MGASPQRRVRDDPASFSCSFIGVETPPGTMALTRMLSAASSSAATLVRAMSPALLAQ